MILLLLVKNDIDDNYQGADSYLIFVNSITYISKVEKKLSMWRNFRFQHMTGVEKSDKLPNLEEFEEI